MGVTGLWRLIEPAGKPVPVETLENKVLAVDISIWLHQMVKGYQDAKGAPVANAHLMGLFQRLCKLLYFRIKPVFVFDGGFPELKRQTIAKRQDNKAKYNSESERLKRELALLLTKKTAISGLLGKQISPRKSSAGPTQNDDDIFKLPALPAMEETESESEEESSSSSSVDIHTIDVESENFKTLPAKEKFDLLIELKETRKMNSWGRLHELPKKSDTFSDFQMQRLLKRRKIQECLEETEKEMGDGGMSITELESLLNAEGIDTNIESLPTKRIASNNTTRFLLINDVKQALEEAKKKKEEAEAGPSKTVNDNDQNEAEKPKTDELEEDLEKAIQMSLECATEGDTNAYAKTDDSWTSYYSDLEYSSDSEENDGAEPCDMSTAKAYIMQYTDFTSKAISKLVSHKEKDKNKKRPIVHEIIEEINNENSVIVDKLDISSDENEPTEIVSKENESTSSSVEENATPEPTSNNDVNATQSSVVFVDNQVPDIIMLNSSLEDNPKEVDKSPKTCQAVKTDSDSSDNDFEDVPDVEESPKTIVQLTLNNDINYTLEEDIFADIFEDKEVNKKTIPTKKENSTNKTENVKISKVNTSDVIDDEDDELQKAIQMSLECVTEDNSEVNKITQIQNISIESNSKDITIVPKKVHIPGPSVKNTKEQQEVTDPDNTQTMLPTTSKQSNPQKETITVEKLNDMVEEINTEEQELIQEKGRLDRVGRNITEQMTKDAQELLQLFGIPYIIAPMEAEAQCAFLESVNLTDGTITDDSDIWLFGGKTVYKNFFNQKKHVLQFLADRIEKSFNLSREQLILLALLVGSDYTVGLSGVGPVTALEILASFPFSKRKLSNETVKQEQYAQLIAGLQEFKQWVRSGKRTDNTSLKKKLRNVSVTDDFPSGRVVQAYLEPNVERSEDSFTWGEIDVNVLRNYTKTKFGWSQNKLDEIIKPVVKRLTERKSQKSVHDYFKRKTDFQSLEDHMSKRVKAAVQKMGPDNALEETSATQEEKSKPNRKRKTKAKNITEAGPSKPKQTKTEEKVLTEHSVKIVSEIKDGKSAIDIKIHKTDRYQEIIPQREKDKQSLLENKMKAIEVFRKNTIDKKKKLTKRKAVVPKADAGLSESDSD